MTQHGKLKEMADNVEFKKKKKRGLVKILDRTPGQQTKAKLGKQEGGKF